MKVKKAIAKKESNSTSSVYLTKRILVATAKSASKKAALETMKVMGYNVMVEKGKVIRKYSDGRIEIISTIKKSSLNGKKLLD